MKLLIYGAGAVGGYLAVHLEKAGHEITVITRSAAERITEDGLRLKKANGRMMVTKPTAVSSLRQAAVIAQGNNIQYDYIILGMKSYDLADAINELVAFFPDPPPLITMQNGIDAEEPLIKPFGADQIIAGSFTVPVRYDSQLRIVEERGDRGLALSGMGGRPRPQAEAKMFADAGINTEVIADYRAMKWSKALTNMLGNATAAIVNRSPAVLYRSRLIFKLEMRMVKEMLDVMKAADIKTVDLPGVSVKLMLRGRKWLPNSLLKPVMARQLRKGRGDKMPSFQIDLASGKRKNEVISHNGAVARYGEKLGVSTPVNAALTDILMAVARGEQDWSRYDGRPKELIAAVNDYIRNRNRS